MLQAIKTRTAQSRAMHLYPPAALASILAVLLMLCACAGIPVTYHDATTYTHLTDLKVETTLLVESFDSRKVKENEEKIGAVRMSFKKAYEYERGKGDANSDTIKQFAKIMQLFEEDITTYRENGPGGLGKNYFREASVVLGQAFDIAIATENEKNKDKR
jgi:hypothetical protein